MSDQCFTEQATHSAEVALQSTQRLANEALDKLSHSAHRGMETVRDASDSTVSFIKHEPIKSVLIAAATGAALMALVGLMNRPHARG